jgi:excisionase family DNA binding protein
MGVRNARNFPKMTVIVNKRLLNAKSAAEYLSIGKSLLYDLAAKGKIPSLKINSRRLFDVNDLDDYVDKLKEEQRGK